MILCNYLSDEDRELLIQIQNQLSVERDMSKIAELRERYQEVSNRAKPLNECTLQECVELKAHVYDKFRRVSGVGKYSIAAQFREMIRQIDIRSNLLYAEMAKEEHQKVLEKSESSESENEKSSKPRIRKSKNKTSWSVSFDDLDF